MGPCPTFNLYSATTHVPGAMQTQLLVTLPLVVAQYKIEDHPRRTHHWSLVALMNRSNARVFQLIGNKNNFQYRVGHTNQFTRSKTLRGGCQVGHIEADKLDWLAQRLQEVDITYNDLDFDCQTWILGALRLLHNDEGVEISIISEKAIREELKEEENRWEQAEDTIEERLFPSA